MTRAEALERIVSVIFTLGVTDTEGNVQARNAMIVLATLQDLAETLRLPGGKTATNAVSAMILAGRKIVIVETAIGTGMITDETETPKPMVTMTRGGGETMGGEMNASQPSGTVSVLVTARLTNAKAPGINVGL